MPKPLSCLHVTFVATVLFASSPVNAGVSVRSLEPLQAGGSAHAQAINHRGDIVGGAIFEGNDRAVLWRDGIPILLEDLPGVRYSSANAINLAGEIVGNSQIKSSTWEVHGLVWRDGNMEDLGTDTSAFGINNRGEIVGCVGARGVDSWPCVWRDGELTLLPLPVGVDFGEARAINERGQIVGWGVPSCALVWEGEEVTVLEPSWDFAEANGINNRGQIAGYFEPLAAVWWKGAFNPLSGLPGGDSSVALAVNNTGDYVGWSTTTQNNDATIHGLLWRKGRMVDLPPMPGGDFSMALGVNDRGQVVGYATGDGFQLYAVVWE